MFTDSKDSSPKPAGLEELLQALLPMSTMHTVAGQVLEALAGDFRPTEQLKYVVRLDPVLTCTLLSAASSHSQNPQTIEQCWKTLAPEQIIGPVLATTLASVPLPTPDWNSPGEQLALWRHSLAVGFICQAASQKLEASAPIANEASDKSPEYSRQTDLAYTAGLLHDLGSLALSDTMPKSLNRARTSARLSGCDLLETERMVFGFDHATLGRHLADRFALPPELIECLWLHHYVGPVATPRLPGGLLLRLVIFADALATELSLGPADFWQPPIGAAELAGELGLPADFLAQLGRTVSEKLDDAERMLALDQPPQAGACSVALTKIANSIVQNSTAVSVLQAELARQTSRTSRAESLAEQFAQAAYLTVGQTDHSVLDAQVSQMAAGAAHELNNPLAVISGRSQLLVQKETDPDKKKNLELIDQQARLASAMVSELLAAVRAPPPKAGPVHLEPIIRKLCAALAGKAQATNSQVSCELPPDLPRAFIDPDMFEQALLEILKNALSALADKPGQIRVSCHLDQLQEKLSLEVTDSGIGMDAATASNAFVPFFSSRPAGRSRGLGLTRAKALIQANQGRLWIRSRPGQGTSVWMSLPLVKEG